MTRSGTPPDRSVWTFFYGSYMSRRVLLEVDLEPGRFEPARLHGFDIRIAPRANLVRSDAGTVYGVLATATHAELDRLYTHARDVLGETYLPEAVLAQSLDGRWQAALCYVASEMAPRKAAPDYLERILEPAREMGFPDWYLKRIEAFR